MQQFKKTSRKDPDGRVIHTCDGVDHVRRKSADGKFHFRKASDKATRPVKAKSLRSKAVTRSLSKAKAPSKRKTVYGGQFYPARKFQYVSELTAWTNLPGEPLSEDLFDELSYNVGESLGIGDLDVVQSTPRFKEFRDFLESRAAEAAVRGTRPPIRGVSPSMATEHATDSFRFLYVQFVHHDPNMADEDEDFEDEEPEEKPHEIRLLLWFSDDVSSDDYFHFARPRDRRIRKRFEWVGHSGMPGGRKEGPHIGITRDNKSYDSYDREEYVTNKNRGDDGVNPDGVLLLRDRPEKKPPTPTKPRKPRRIPIIDPLTGEVVTPAKKPRKPKTLNPNAAEFVMPTKTGRKIDIVNPATGNKVTKSPPKARSPAARAPSRPASAAPASGSRQRSWTASEERMEILGSKKSRTQAALDKPASKSASRSRQRSWTASEERMEILGSKKSRTQAAPDKPAKQPASGFRQRSPTMSDGSIGEESNLRRKKAKPDGTRVNDNVSRSR